MDALAEFAAGAGHEINNPLAIIGGHARLLLQEIEHPEHRRQLAVIVAQVQRAYEMIADIRLFARPPQPELESFLLLDWLQNLLEEERLLLEKAGITLQFEPVVHLQNPDSETFVRKLDELPLCLRTDPAMLHVVLSALLRNAREALLGQNHEPEIRLILRQRGNDLEFAVEDNGPGIADEIRPLIFCPYYSSRQAGRGLGFGLPKAWRFLEMLDGSIRVETPEDGQGSRFVATIPLE